MANGAGIEARNVAGAMTSMRIDELISNLAIGIAQGQMELDGVCMDIAKFMGDAQIAFGKRAGSDEPDLLSLIELGFTPNFYQFVDTILEVRVAISSEFEESREYDVSQSSLHQDEYSQQNEYESQRSHEYSGSSYSYGRSGSGWWWGGARSGYGSSRAYSGASSSRYGGSSSYKNTNLSCTTVDAKYASTYNYSVEGSSLIKTKIVPIPPPDVFEEIIRAKLQERKEWEQRMRLIDQSRSILGSVLGSADSITTDEEGLDKLIAEFKKDHAARVHDAVLNLQDEYNQLTTDHWAVIKNSVRDREAADIALNSAIEKVQQIVDYYPDEPKDVSLEDLLDALKNHLETFKLKINDIQEKLPPEEEKEAPEEAPSEDENTDGGEK